MCDDMFKCLVIHDNDKVEYYEHKREKTRECDDATENKQCTTMLNRNKNNIILTRIRCGAHG